MFLIAVTPYSSVQVRVVSGGSKEFETAEEAYLYAKIRAVEGFSPTVKKVGNSHVVTWRGQKKPTVENPDLPAESENMKTDEAEKFAKNFDPIPIPSKGKIAQGAPLRECVDCGKTIPSARIEQYPKAERCASCADKNAPPPKALPSSEIGGVAPPKLGEGFGGSREDWKKMRRGYLGDGRKGS